MIFVFHTLFLNEEIYIYSCTRTVFGGFGPINS